MHGIDLKQLIEWGGYAVLFAIVFAETGLLVGFFLPGDSLLVTAGLVCAIESGMNIWLMAGLLTVAAVLGDSVGYAFGYHIGPRIFTKEDSLFFNKAHLLRAQKFYEKYGAKTIVLARFVPIVRTFAPTVAGVGRMKYSKFISYNIFGGALWIWSMALLGYFLGRSIPDIDKKIHWVALAVIILSFLPILKEWLDHRKQAKTEEKK